MHNKRSLKILKDEFLQYLPDEIAEHQLIKNLNMHKYLDIHLNRNPFFNA